MIAVENPTPRFAVLPPRSVGGPAPIEEAVAPSDGDGPPLKPFGDDGLTFLDLLDVINPLQHLPVIGTLYRDLTGDTIAPAPRIAGATLFGGPIGTFMAVVNVATESETGRDLGDHVLAWFEDDAEDAPSSLASGSMPLGKPSTFAPSLGAGQILPDSQALDWGVAAGIRDGDAAALAEGEAGLQMVLEDSSNAAVPSAGPATIERRAGTPETSGGVLFGPGGKAAHGAIGGGSSVEPTPTEAAAAKETSEGQPSGAAAADGGWFAEAMLSALAKYEQAQALKDASDAQPDPGAATGPVADPLQEMPLSR